MQVKPLALVLLLAACGQGGLVGGVVAKVTGARASGTVVAPISDRQIWVTMEAMRIKFAMVPIEQDGATTIWASQDGSQISLRDGIIVATRGFGMDLMSADAPSAATLRGGAGHTRVYHLLDGADAPQRMKMTCQVTAKPGQDGLRQLDEACSAGVLNEYLLSGNGQIVKSRQWVSPKIGYLIISADKT